MQTSRNIRADDWKDRYFRALNELDALERTRGEALTRLSRDLLAVLHRCRALATRSAAQLEVPAVAGALAGEAAQTQLHALVADWLRRTEPLAASAPAAGHELPATAISVTEPLDAVLAAVTGSARVHEAVAALRNELGTARDAAEQLELVARIAAGLSGILAQPEAERALAARDSLQSLVDHLSLPEPAQARLNALTPKLQRARDGAAVLESARELADFIADYIGELHVEITSLGSFLVVVKARLGEVAGVLSGGRAERGRAARARGELGDSIQSSLASLRGQLAEASSLERLKQDIQAHIAVLDSTLNAYLDSAAEHAAQIDDTEVRCARQLVELESEAEHLRRQLASAQARALHDNLTGLPNRLAYTERITHEYARWRRDGRPLAIAVIDIDHFKSINDSWGHQAGDRVLKHLARELGSKIRAQDFFGRYGGEEFVLILPGTARAGALAVLEALRRHIAECRFTFKDAPVAVTISCGVAEFATTDDAAQVFARADRALYLAKARGRNRCEVQDPA